MYERFRHTRAGRMRAHTLRERDGHPQSERARGARGARARERERERERDM